MAESVDVSPDRVCDAVGRRAASTGADNDHDIDDHHVDHDHDHVDDHHDDTQHVVDGGRVHHHRTECQHQHDAVDDDLSRADHV